MKAIIIHTICIAMTLNIAAQNVGIGTDTPQSKLHVAGTMRGDSLVLSLDSAQTEILRLENSSCIQQNTISFHYPINETGWQSFTASSGGNILEVRIYINNPGGVSLIKLYAGEGVSTNLLYTQNVSLPPSGGWISLPSMPVNIQEGQVYSIWFNNVEGFGIGNGNLYPAGVFNGDGYWDMSFRITISDSAPLVIGGTGPASLRMSQPGSILDVNGTMQSDHLYAANKLGVGWISDYPLTIRGDAYDRIMGIYDSTVYLQWQWFLDSGKLTLTPGNTAIKVLSMESNGNIGMGTASPQSLLHLMKSAQSNGANDLLRIENTGSGGAGIRFKNSAISKNLWQCYVASDGKYKIGRDGIADYLIIAVNGNIGIGTSTPEKALHVNGDVKVTGRITSDPVVAPTLLNNWVNYNDGFEVAGYFKDKFDMVHLHGLVKSGTTTHIMTLPSGYRPVGTQLFTVVSGTGFARLDVNPDGTVVLSGSYSNAYVSLNGISFRS